MPSLNQDQPLDDLSRSAYERRIQRLEDERKELVRKLTDTNIALQKMAHGSAVVNPPVVGGSPTKANNEDSNKASEKSGAEVRKLQDEVNRLTKRNSELETSVSSLEQQSKEMSNLKRDIEFAESEKSNKVRDLEKQLKQTRLEKDDFSRDLTDAQEKLKLQSKELKDAVAQRKLAMSEYTEVTDKLSELRQQKQKLSRTVRDKEEELETSLQKIDTLRQDIRKAEKLRRELELRAEDSLNEAAKEKKMREKAEKELVTVKGGSSPSSDGPLTANNNDQELTALRAEVERLEIASQESILAQQSKHNAELADIRGQFDESERRIRAYEMDVQALREKLDKARLDSLQESEETMNEMRNVYEREKLMLMEENKKLQVGARCWTLNYIFGFSVKSEFLCTRQQHS